MLELNDNLDRLEGELKLSDCESEFVVRWLSGSSQASFFIGDTEEVHYKIKSFISGKKYCYINLPAYLAYLKSVEHIVKKYKSMYYGPFDHIANIYARFSSMKQENAKVVLSYDYPERYIRILNNKKGRKDNVLIYGEEVLKNGDDFRHSYIGGITKIVIDKKDDNHYQITVQLIENWRDVIMKENGAKVTLESLISIFNTEMDNNISSGKTECQSGQIFGIKYAPLLESNKKKFEYQEIVRGSKYNNDDVLKAVELGVAISSDVIWSPDLSKELENELIDDGNNEDDLLQEFNFSSSPINDGQNLIVYGTPGCGKSYYVQNTLLKDYKEENYIRTTFFQDYTNTDFVGQILPSIEKDENDKDVVTYKFNPGPFTLALEQAIRKPNERVAIVIEELNRGSAANIFGDIFQLLDRKNGVSEYSITNVNIINYLKEKFDGEYTFKEIRIPGNLFIFATMNTSDQNVFTLDTAFKRRWKFKKLINKFDTNHKFKDKYIPGPSGKADITWEKVVNAINDYILSFPDELNSEDKQIGVYFIDEKGMRDDKDTISTPEEIETFAYKVFEYLWDDVAKFSRPDWFEKEIKSLDQLVEEYKKSGIEVFNDDVFKEK